MEMMDTQITATTTLGELLAMLNLGEKPKIPTPKALFEEDKPIADMSPPMKELYKLLLEGKFIHGGNPVLRWMAGNVVAEIDAAENIKPSKRRSNEKIDGIVSWIMALDRCIRHEMQGSVYDDPDHELVII